MTDKTQAYSVSLSDGFRKEFTAVGGKIVTEQFYSTGGTDFKAQIVAIKAKKPSGIFMSGYFNEAGPIARQVADAGLKVRMMGGDGWESSQTLISGGDAILGSYYCTPYNNKENRPEVKKFLAKWTKKYGGEIPETSMAALAYDATTVACDALKRANSQDSAGMRVAIENTIGFDGVTGTNTLKRKHGNPPKRALVVKLTKDGPVFVKAYEPEAVTGR